VRRGKILRPMQPRQGDGGLAHEHARVRLDQRVGVGLEEQLCYLDLVGSD
jgi:hypothetical protein